MTCPNRLCYHKGEVRKVEVQSSICGNPKGMKAVESGANHMKNNYHKIMIEQIKKLSHRPRLLLHSCCAPCSSYVIQFLTDYFDLEIFFFNPNIYPESEYHRRLEEQIRLVAEMGLNYRVIGPEHQSSTFYQAVKGYEHLGEGSERCDRCFGLRLEETAKRAKAEEFDYFTTTLTISPLKNAERINQIGMDLAKRYQTSFLNSDFKKNNGYRCSVELSKQYGLYRQHYCGCVFSQQEQENRIKTVGNP